MHSAGPLTDDQRKLIAGRRGEGGGRLTDKKQKITIFRFSYILAECVDAGVSVSGGGEGGHDGVGVVLLHH